MGEALSGCDGKRARRACHLVEVQQRGSQDKPVENVRGGTGDSVLNDEGNNVKN